MAQSASLRFWRYCSRLHLRHSFVLKSRSSAYIQTRSLLLPDLLINASARIQLIVTTHSPELISGLSEHAGSVLICEHLRGTRVERLDPDKLQHWLDNYRLGEVWRIGELGGNP